MFDVTYAHCIDDSQKMGYVFRTVKATMYRHKADRSIGDIEDSFSVEVDGLTAYGDTKAESVSDAQYRLMDRSRGAYYSLQASA